MKSRFLAFIVTAAVVAAACSTGATATPSAAASTVSAAPSTATPSAASTVSAAPSTATAACTKTYNLWYVNPLPTTPDWGRSGDLFKAAAAQDCYTATVVGPAAIDIPTMINEMDQAIAAKADGILTCPLDVSAFKSEIQKAKTAGIVVGSIGCVDSDAAFSVGTDNAVYGTQAADFIAKATSNSGQVGILGTDQTTPNQVLMEQAFKAEIAAKYPNMKILTWEGDNSDASVAAQKFPAMIKAYPTMNYLFIIEGAAPGAVEPAFKEAGVQPGKIGVLAIDAQASTLASIADGYISASFVQCWFNASPQAAKRMIQAKNGQTQPAFVSISVAPITKADLPFAGCPSSTTNY